MRRVPSEGVMPTDVAAIEMRRFENDSVCMHARHHDVIISQANPRGAGRGPGGRSAALQQQLARIARRSIELLELRRSKINKSNGGSAVQLLRSHIHCFKFCARCPRLDQLLHGRSINQEATGH